MIDPEQYYDNKEKYIGSLDFDMFQFIVNLFEYEKGEAYETFQYLIDIKNPFEVSAYNEITSNLDYIKMYSDTVGYPDKVDVIADSLDNVSVIQFFHLIQSFYPDQTKDWYFESAQSIDMETLELKEYQQWSSNKLDKVMDFRELSHKISLLIEVEFDKGYKKVSKLLNEKLTIQDLLLFFGLDSIEEDDENCSLIYQAKVLLS